MEGQVSNRHIDDVWKQTLLYNADLRLKSRQREIKEKRGQTPFEKKTLAYYGIAAVFLILAYVFLLRLVTYDVERYVSVFSATIQGVSTIFALVAAGTLLLLERVGARSPRALSFLPVLWVTGLFSVFATVTILDVLTMLALPIDSSWSWLVDLTFVLNMACVILTIFYIKGLLTWLRPETVFRILQNKAAKVKSKEEAVEIINSIRELAIGSTLNHDHLTTKLAIDACNGLSSVFCQRWKGENPGYNIRHPIREVAYCTRDIAVEAISEGMDDIGSSCVETICLMAFYHHFNRIHIDEWIFGSIEHIAEELIKKKEGSSPIFTLILEAKVAADQDRLDLAHWLVCNFDDFAEAAGAYRDLEAARTLAIGIEILGEVFSKRATSVDTMGSLSRAVEILERFSRDKSFGSYTGYFGKRGWSNERTISEILEKTKSLIETAAQKAFTPREGDWPT